MATVKQEYIKNKNKEIISPITSAKSVYGMIEPLLEVSSVGITTSGSNFMTNKSMNNYNMIMINLKTSHNYAGAWFIPKSNFLRNNTFNLYDQDGLVDTAFTQGITNTTLTIRKISNAHELYLLGIYGLFPITE